MFLDADYFGQLIYDNDFLSAKEVKMKQKIKGIVLSALIVIAPLSAHAKIFDSIYEAQKTALKEAKLMVFVVAANSCQFCHRYLNDFLSNQSLMKYIEDKFVFTIIDVENGGKIPRDLLFNGNTPTTYILTPTGKPIGMPIEGPLESGALLTLLVSLEAYKKEQLGF